MGCSPILYLLPAFFIFFIISLMILKRIALRWLSPCLIPVTTDFLSANLFFTLTYVLIPLFISRIISIHLWCKSRSFTNLNMSCNLSLSNAYVRSIKHLTAVLLLSIAFLAIWQSMSIAPIMDLFCRNPCCFSLLPQIPYNLSEAIFSLCLKQE